MPDDTGGTEGARPPPPRRGSPRATRPSPTNCSPPTAPATPAALAPGVAGAKRWVAGLRRAFPDLSAVVEAQITEGDTVVQRIVCGGTHRGAFLGPPPTGRCATWQVVAIWRIARDGKVATQCASVSACWKAKGGVDRCRPNGY